MSIVVSELREDDNIPNQYHALVNGISITVVTRPGQDPIKVIEEAFEESEPTYADKRVQEYPSLQEQLDMIYHDMDGWRTMIAEIKAKYPK